MRSSCLKGLISVSSRQELFVSSPPPIDSLRVLSKTVYRFLFPEERSPYLIWYSPGFLGRDNHLGSFFIAAAKGGELLQTRMIWKRNAISQPISTGKLAHCCASTPRLFRSDLLRAQKLVLRHDFLLDRLSAVTRSKRSYPAMLLAQQLVDQRFTIPGPLVQRNDSLSFKHPKKIGTVLPLGALNPTHVPLSSANSRTLGTSTFRHH